MLASETIKSSFELSTLICQIFLFGTRRTYYSDTLAKYLVIKNMVKHTPDD
jgi:hypothetical protein